MEEPARYRFVVARSAAKDLRRCPKREQVLVWLERLCMDPFAADSNIKPLTGMTNAYRRWFGDWCVSYRIDQAERVLEVFEMAPRGRAYR